MNGHDRASESSAKTLGLGVAVMAKASAAGRTKTRLVPPLTADQAACLNTSFLQDVADNLLLAGRSVPLRAYMAYGPAGSGSFFESILPSGIGLIESWIGPFGDCLFHAVDELFARGHAAACVLNSDSPTLPTSLLLDVASRLALPGDRAVLGPSDDGGYYLLALKSPHRRLFEEIAWSTHEVADQTLERAREIGLPVEVLPTWYDVDDRTSLRRLYGELVQDRPFAPGLKSFGADHTRAVLGGFVQEPGLREALGGADAGPIEAAAGDPRRAHA